MPRFLLSSQAQPWKNGVWQGCLLLPLREAESICLSPLSTGSPFFSHPHQMSFLYTWIQRVRAGQRAEELGGNKCSQLRRWGGVRSQTRKKSRAWERRGGVQRLWRRAGLAEPFQGLSWPETKGTWHILKKNKISKLNQPVYRPPVNVRVFYPWTHKQTQRLPWLKRWRKMKRMGCS